MAPPVHAKPNPAGNAMLYKWVSQHDGEFSMDMGTAVHKEVIRRAVTVGTMGPVIQSGRAPANVVSDTQQLGDVVAEDALEPIL